jgi:exodeoxyribonuclease-3
MLQWLSLRKMPEVVCLQETKVLDEVFPFEVYRELGYHVEVHGQKTYNGVAFLSRYPLEEVTRGMENAMVDKEARVIAATINGVRIVNVYVPNGSSPASEKYIWKFEFLQAFKKYLHETLKQYDDALVVGDFNIAPEPLDIYDASYFKGHIMYTDKERALFQEILKLGLVDVFRAQHPDAPEFTWYDYRTQAFIGKRGWRIDFALASKKFFPKIEASALDQEPRGWEKASDHCPVVVKVK